LENEVLKTIRYFSFFDYPPTFEEIYTFLGKKTTKKKIEEVLKNLERQKKIKKLKNLNNVTRYTLDVTHKNTVGEYSTRRKASNLKTQNSNLKTEKYNQKYLFSQEKLENWRFRAYVKILSFFPQIKLVGLSGSLAMMNADKGDDIDLFIITAKNKLFTGRFLAIILAKILSIHRSYNKRYTLYVTRYTNTVCLNLFFDESDLAVPEFKRSEYVAHEVLQMKPIVNKDNIYERFLKANSWVFKIFPNAQTVLKLKIENLKFNENFKLKIKNFGDWLENLLKKLQLYMINKHRTTEIINDTQLWFHPDDFEKKIKFNSL
jgi:predicted nucleotidyltransferase